MKFQCGECNKYYKINSENIPSTGASFNCDNCDNKFTVSGNLTLSSTNGNSKLACGNCGEFLHEDIKTCEKCNLKISKHEEELRIDNKYYENLNLDDKGQVSSDNSPKKGRKILAFCSVGCVCVISAVLGFYYYKENVNASSSVMLPAPVTKLLNIDESPSENKTNVVILKNGSTIYAVKLEKEGLYYTLTGANGMQTEVKVDDVLQVTEAVINK